VSDNRTAREKIPSPVVTLFVRKDRDFESIYDTESIVRLAFSGAGDTFRRLRCYS